MDQPTDISQNYENEQDQGMHEAAAHHASMCQQAELGGAQSPGLMTYSSQALEVPEAPQHVMQVRNLFFCISAQPWQSHHATSWWLLEALS